MGSEKRSGNYNLYLFFIKSQLPLNSFLAKNYYKKIENLLILSVTSLTMKPEIKVIIQAIFDK